MEAERFAIDDLAGHDLPDGTIVARNRRTGARMPLPGEVFNAISYCDAFRTMEEHIAHLAGPAAKGREEEIRRILQSVIDGGLMLSASEIGRRLEPRPGEPVKEAPVAAIITRERPQALSRLLESMQRHCELERLDRLVVVDDSRSEEALAANRAAVEDAGRALQARGLNHAIHFTPDDASKLLRALIGQLPEHETAIRFLLDRDGRATEVTTGIARNLAQLLAVGRPLLVFDDDVSCTVMEPPQTEGGVEFSIRQRDCRFYASDAEWEGRRSTAMTCPIARHMQALGSPLAVCLYALGQARPGPSAFEFATPGFARRLKPDSRIVISQCGSYGDPGSAGNEWLVLLPAESRAQLAALTADIASAPEERNCWLGRGRPVFEPRANMSQLTGSDNRGYLPPYFPLFRGQDRAFGAMAEFLHPQGLAADLPFALPHLPMPRRSWREGHRGFSAPFNLAHFLNDFITGQIPNCGARDVMSRNDWLAMLFFDLSESPRERIMEISDGHWTQRRINWMSHLTTALDESAGAPDHLSDYLRSAMDQLRKCGIAGFNSSELEGPPGGLRGDAVLDYWRSAWRDFSAGLRAWPQVRDAAQEILGSSGPELKGGQP